MAPLFEVFFVALGAFGVLYVGTLVHWWPRPSGHGFVVISLFLLLVMVVTTLIEIRELLKRIAPPKETREQRKHRLLGEAFAEADRQGESRK